MASTAMGDVQITGLKFLKSWELQGGNVIKKEIIKEISLFFTLNMTLASLMAASSSPLTCCQGTNPINSCLKAEFFKTAFRFAEDQILAFKNQVNSCMRYFIRKNQNNETKITPHTKQTHTFALAFHDISLKVCFYVVSLRKSGMGRYFQRNYGLFMETPQKIFEIMQKGSCRAHPSQQTNRTLIVRAKLFPNLWDALVCQFTCFFPKHI